MYFTHLVNNQELAAFDVRRLSLYQRFIFIVTLLEEDAADVVSAEAARLEACDALCSVVGPKSMTRLLEVDALRQLLAAAESSNLTSEASRICVIDRHELLRNASPRGRWYELFLRVDDDMNERRRKVRGALFQAIRDDPLPSEKSVLGANAPKLLVQLIGAIARLVATAKGVS